MEYRVYAIGVDGRIVKAMGVVCDDDDQAKEEAKKLLQDASIEIWSGARLVAQFKRDN